MIGIAICFLLGHVSLYIYFFIFCLIYLIYFSVNLLIYLFMHLFVYWQTQILREELYQRDDQKLCIICKVVARPSPSPSHSCVSYAR